MGIDAVDDRRNYGELRFNIIGKSPDGIMLFVTYTVRGERVRHISARRASRQERERMTTSDPSAARENLPRRMAEDEVMAAALADPDAQPMTAEQKAALTRRGEAWRAVTERGKVLCVYSVYHLAQELSGSPIITLNARDQLYLALSNAFMATSATCAGPRAEDPLS